MQPPVAIYPLSYFTHCVRKIHFAYAVDSPLLSFNTDSISDISPVCGGIAPRGKLLY